MRSALLVRRRRRSGGIRDWDLTGSVVEAVPRGSAWRVRVDTVLRTPRPASNPITVKAVLKSDYDAALAAGTDVTVEPGTDLDAQLGDGDWRVVAGQFVSGEFTLGAGADVTGPVLTLPTDVANGSTGVDWGFTTDTGEVGSLAWVVVTPTSTKPSTAQMKAGSGGGIAATTGSFAVTTPGAKAGTITGLAAGYSGFIHAYQEDAAGNPSNIVTGDGFTTAAASFVPIDNQATAYSRTGGGALVETGHQKFLMAIRFDPAAFVSNQNIMANDLADKFRYWLATTSKYRFQFCSSGACSLIPANSTFSTGMQTHFISLDFTQATDGTGCYWYKDNTALLSNSPGTGGAFSTLSGAATFGTSSGTRNMGWNANGLGLFAEADGGGLLLDGSFEFLWMHFADASLSLPDLSNPTVRSAWTAANIGANGSGPLGFQPKGYWTAASVAAANDTTNGIPNLGSLTGRPLLKQAGTYA